MKYLDQRRALADIGTSFHARGWSVGTSSNYSVVVSRDPLRLLITASGKDKGALQPADFAVLDDRAQPTDGAQPKSSAETWLHIVLGGQPDVGAILHTHSIWGTLVSDWCASAGAVRMEGYEMLKGLEGISTHQTTFDLEIFENTQDIPSLARKLEVRLRDAVTPLQHGFLLRRHGLYTWGRDLFEARRHVEIIEFLLECVGRQMQHSKA
jgi:methylthioribulose-1-phosphate dehydratase